MRRGMLVWSVMVNGCVLVAMFPSGPRTMYWRFALTGFVPMLVMSAERVSSWPAESSWVKSERLSASSMGALWVDLRAMRMPMMRMKKMIKRITRNLGVTMCLDAPAWESASSVS